LLESGINAIAKAIPRHPTVASSKIPLFCHSPVFRIISSFQRPGMLSDAAFNDDILTNLALSSISTQKKAGDRLICKSSSI